MKSNNPLTNLKYSLPVLCVFIMISFSTSCSSHINQYPVDTPSTYITEEPIAPTLDCAGFYDSGIYPPTSTPTFIKEINSSGDLEVFITRDIAYETERFRCLDLLSSDINLLIVNKGTSYHLSIVDIVKESERFTGFDVTGRLIREVEIVSVEDLDNDGDDEIAIYIHTRGASCCTGFVVIYHDEIESEYRASNSIWRGYSLPIKPKDIDNDGYPEYITYDDTCTHPSTVVRTISPIKIYKYANNIIIDATRHFPGGIEVDANQWLEYFHSTDDDLRKGLSLIAYLVDMYNLGRETEGNEIFEELCKASLDNQLCQNYMDISVRCVDDWVK